MTIKVNNDYTFDVKEKDLIVKDGKLYNTTTKSFEGIEGDLVEFELKDFNNRVMVVRGTVDGYTYGGRVKLRGRDTVYTDATNKKVTNISSITEENIVVAPVMEID